VALPGCEEQPAEKARARLNLCPHDAHLTFYYIQESRPMPVASWPRRPSSVTARFLWYGAREHMLEQPWPHLLGSRA
jgi:hypothetical protein